MGAGGAERFDIQDRFVVELRRFASECNVHVSLVCHPRKHDAGWPLQLDSIYGGVRLTQEADNVVLLQRYKQNAPSTSMIRHFTNLYGYSFYKSASQATQNTSLVGTMFFKLGGCTRREAR